MESWDGNPRNHLNWSSASVPSKTVIHKLYDFKTFVTCIDATFRMCRIECGTFFTLRAECNICHDSVTLKEGSCSDIWNHLQTVHALIKFCQDEDLPVKGKGKEEDFKEEVLESDDDGDQKFNLDLETKSDEDERQKNEPKNHDQSDEESNEGNDKNDPTVKITIERKEKQKRKRKKTSQQPSVRLTFSVAEHSLVKSETSVSCNYCDYTYEGKKGYFTSSLREHILRNHKDVLSEEDRKIAEEYHEIWKMKIRERNREYRKRTSISEYRGGGGNPAIIKLNPWEHFMQRSETAVACNYCDYVYEGKPCNAPTSMRQHIYRVHKDMLSEEVRAVAEKYHERKKLRQREKNALRYEQVCTICGKMYTSKNSMICHMKTAHSQNEPKFFCTFEGCGKGFSSNNNYKKHLTCHSDVKAFSCRVCGKGFKQKSTCTNHEKVHSGETKFQCKECGKFFRHAHGLFAHSVTHTGERPYKCPLCDKDYTSDSVLRYHLKHSHPGSDVKIDYASVRNNLQLNL